MKQWSKVEVQNEEKQKKEVQLIGILEQHDGLFHIGKEFFVYLKRKELLGKKVKIVRYSNNTSSKTNDKYLYFVHDNDLEVLDETNNEELENGSK